jgi:ATP-dependent RNA helicase RhlE
LSEFATLGLSELAVRAVEKEGYTSPTPIQKQSIPHLLEGRDLMGIAQTGTGKTAAFALPILDRMKAEGKKAPGKGCLTLVLAPTRELAAQIAESFTAYGRFMNVRVAVVVGGVKHGPQIRALNQGLDVLVATPGRLLDHLESRNVRLDATRYVVLDEADHMLDLGFLVPIKRILKHLPRERQNIFFSATMPKQIGDLAKDMLNDPVHVAVTPVATTQEKVAQDVFFVETSRKREVLAEFLAKPEFTRTLVFTRTKRGADRVAKYLTNAGINASAIHGDKSQGQREKALQAFKSGRAPVLVATDIAARGIDVDKVSHVINFDLPEVPEAYVHRIGRTARAGEEGVAYSLVDGSERGLLRDIEKATRQSIKSTDLRLPGAVEEEEFAKPAKKRRGGRGENRNGGAPKANAQKPGNAQKPADAKKRSRPRRNRQGQGNRQMAA